MRPTENQVMISLAELRGSGQGVSGADDDFEPQHRHQSHHSHFQHEPDLSAEMISAVREAPEIRLDLLEEARNRLDRGEQPSADALAERMVGRLICDRLR